MSAFRKHLPRVLLLACPVAFLVVMFCLPLVRMLARSVMGPAGFTLVQYNQLFSSPIYIDSLLWTMRLAFFTSLLSLLLGYPIAYVAAHCGPRLRMVLLTCVVLPLWVSSLVRAFAWIGILGPIGVLNTILMWLGVIDTPIKMLFNTVSVYIGTVHIMLPYMVLSLYSSMTVVDRTVVRAAETLGASPLRAFSLVYVPQTMPGIVSGFILVFIISLGFFVTPAVLGGPGVQSFVILVEQYMNLLLNWPFAATLSVVLLVATLSLYALFGRQLGLAAAQKDIARSGAVSLHKLLAGLDKLLRPLRLVRRGLPSADGWRLPRIDMARIFALLMVIVVTLPIIHILVFAFGTSYGNRFPPEQFSLRWFDMYFSRREWIEATVNSFQVATGTALLACLLVVPAALGLRQLSGRARAVLLALFLTPMIVPTVVYGVSAYFQLVGVGLVGTRVGLALAHTVLAMPPALLLVFAAVQGLDERLEDAAASLGASAWQRFRFVILPLIAPATISAALVAFLQSFDDLSVALFLTSGEMMTLPKRMYDSIRVETDPRVNAAAALLVGLSLIFLICFQLVRRRSPASQRQQQTTGANNA
jgi:putative spermidine/putrescine transport system permease protein